MKFKNLVLALFTFYLFSGTNLVSKSYGYDDFSVFFNLTRPSRIFPVQGSTAVGTANIDNYYGGGIAYNAFRIDYTTYFEGYKASLNYDFARNSLVSPYVGVSYIGGTNNRYNRVTRQYLNGIDGVLGGSLNIYNVLKPYAEYRFYNSFFGFGLRVHIPMKINKRKATKESK